ncbi:unnamed protein product [Rotaria socialis]|uniref:Palmitoyltransferase n=1 Tax=Rotaria socialis TaxID=392032 RepID=A0A820LX77_9BILA|nr:unnamed protein product [Rotaria socialis]CAF4364155.1 unnamed protein product [Rotaria socialis]
MLFRKDPCGIICVILTYAMLLHCLYVVVCILIIPLFNESFYGTLNAFLICTLVFLATLSHGRAAYSDPGFVPLPKRKLDFSDLKTNSTTNPLLKVNEEGWTVCNRCDTYRPARSHHCRICKRCVRRLDHHCPWINNCVGEFNQKYFILFLFYIGLTSLYAVSFIIWSLIVFPQKSEAQIIHSIVICIEACLFGIFVITVFVDQIQSIIDDRSLIDSLKLDKESRNTPRVLPSKRVLFENVFGSGPIICWLLPCDLRNSNKINDSPDAYTV